MLAHAWQSAATLFFLSHTHKHTQSVYNHTHTQNSWPRTLWYSLQIGISWVLQLEVNEYLLTVTGWICTALKSRGMSAMTALRELHNESRNKTFDCFSMITKSSISSWQCTLLPACHSSAFSTVVHIIGLLLVLGQWPLPQDCDCEGLVSEREVKS